MTIRDAHSGLKASAWPGLGGRCPPGAAGPAAGASWATPRTLAALASPALACTTHSCASSARRRNKRAPRHAARGPVEGTQRGANESSRALKVRPLLAAIGCAGHAPALRWTRQLCEDRRGACLARVRDRGSLPRLLCQRQTIRWCFGWPPLPMSVLVLGAMF